MKTIQICNLKEPADCKHRIDGRMSFIFVCGCNSLLDDFKNCPYKEVAQIVPLESKECCTKPTDELFNQCNINYRQVTAETGNDCQYPIEECFCPQPEKMVYKNESESMTSCIIRTEPSILALKEYSIEEIIKHASSFIDASKFRFIMSKDGNGKDIKD
jgi:hypothetical protein